MPADEKAEKANLTDMLEKTKSDTKPASETIGKLIEYSQGQTEKMTSLDPKWAKKAGGGGGCSIL